MFKKIGLFVFVFAIMIASFGVASKFIIAQDQTPADMAASDIQANVKGLNLFTEEDILERAFPDNKHTCATKMALFMAVGKAYEKGEDISSLVPMKVMRPIFEGYYNSIRDKGVKSAYIDNILEYQSCIKSAGTHEDPEKEKELSKKHRACLKFSNEMLTALDAIQSRKSVNTIMARYENSEPDMSDTAFSDLKRPVMFFVGQVYNMSKTASYDEAVKMGHSLVVACGA